MYRIKLSPYHKIFYQEWKLNPDSSKYNIVFDQTISNTLIISKLELALRQLISDHIIFNSHIRTINQEACWVRNNSISQLEHYSDDNYDRIFQYVSKPFNLENDCLYRFALFSTANNNYRFVSVLHHILIDGSSFDNLISEISQYYNNSHYKLKPNLKTQITDIEAATHKLCVQLELYSETSKSFWSNKLTNVEPIDISFLKKHTNISSQSHYIKELRFNITQDIYPQLLKLYPNYKLSIYGYSQIIFAVLLYRYTSQTKFAFSYPILLKGYQGLTFGAQINTSIFPFSLDEYTTIADLINQVTSFVSMLKNTEFNHGYYPVHNILADTKLNYLNVSFIQTNLKDKEFNFKSARAIKVNHEYNIDLTTQLIFEQELQEQQLKFRIKFNANLIDTNILNQFIMHYKKLFLDILQDIVQGLDSKLILEYKFLNNNEYDLIVNKWNKTFIKYPLEKTIHKLFEEQAIKTPDHIAITNGSVGLSYKELNEKSNQLARYLRTTYYINGDDLIAFCLNRNEHLICILLAILKSGGAYIPIDPSYPDDRIIYILQTAKAKLVITEEIYSKRLSKLLEVLLPQTHISLESVNNFRISNKVKLRSTRNLNTNITSNNLAYVIYTSGTTGTPKGVMIEHKSVVNYISNIKNKIFTTNTKSVDFSTNIGFDLTVTTTLGALCCGYQIYIYSGDVKDFDSYKEHLINNRINIIKISPSYFELLSDILPNTSVDTVILGGEKVSISILHKISKLDLIIYDEYGPTETTVGASLSTIYKYGSLSNNINIGRAYNNYTTYILDTHLRILPIGAIGELYIGGIGLARGYLNQPELTKQKFIGNPFLTNKQRSLNCNSVLYKTGDLVRYLPNGNIEYIGRIDLQVKLRGYRIELSEIESAINTYPDVKQSVVTVIEVIADGAILVNKYLIGYYVSDYRLNEALLLDYLAVKLPEYMIPVALIHIENIPLTINGKVDRGELPKPQLSFQDRYIAPSSDLEHKICMAFSEVLNLPKEDIGANHNFFNLGGNSILAIHLTYKLQKEFQIGVNDIFKLKTPSKIAQCVKLTKSNLLARVKQIKLAYNKLAYIKLDNNVMLNKQQQYLREIQQIRISNKAKAITTVLLTGATGHLGSHILYQLLFETNYKIYLLIRDNSNIKAYTRISNKFKFYFDIELQQYLDRITVFAADIEKPDLNLNIIQYQELVTNVDSIIHSAASVKHYGDYNSFYQTNVMATTNLLELAKLTTLKDFHYISTLSVLTNGYIPDNSYYIFTEDDNNVKLENNFNIYSLTKYEGELAVIRYRQYGINTNIYRVGNLSINSQTYHNQENIGENAFFITVKTFLNLGMIPKEMSIFEISPVDYVALAIVKLFDKIDIKNQTYHIANHYLSNLIKLFADYTSVNVKTATFNKFLNTVLTKLNDPSLSKQIELFMLHQGWLEAIDMNKLTKIIILRDKTDYILSSLGFKWVSITSAMLSEMVNKAV